MRGTRFGVVPAPGPTNDSMALVIFESIRFLAGLAEPVDPVVAQWAIRNVILVSYPHFGRTSQEILLIVKCMWEQVFKMERRTDPDNNNQQTLFVTI